MCGLIISVRPLSTPDRTGHARAADAAIAVGILRQVLLVIVLGVVERRRVGDLGGDAAVAGGGQPILVRARDASAARFCSGDEV